MTVVLVHGLPETAAIWRSLQERLPGPSHAVSLPGFGAGRPAGFDGSKDALAGWLADELRTVAGPLDLVGHDVGALLTLRLVTAGDVPVRRWVVDVAEMFHPDAVWPPRVQQLQTAGVGEDLLADERDQIMDYVERMTKGCARDALRFEIAKEHMDRATLDFYRSAVPNVAADWWPPVRAAGRGLVLLLPDPPEITALAEAVATRLGAATVEVDGLGHDWMAQDPDRIAVLLTEFWATL